MLRDQPSGESQNNRVKNLYVLHRDFLEAQKQRREIRKVLLNVTLLRVKEQKAYNESVMMRSNVGRYPAAYKNLHAQIDEVQRLLDRAILPAATEK